MSEMSLDLQIYELQEMKAYLHDFCVMMNKDIDDLRQDLRNYKAQGFPTEIANKYESNYYSPARNEIEQMINRIQTFHYQYIDAVIEDLDRARNR